MVELDKNFKEMKKQIYSHMLATRGIKYKWFIWGLRSFKYLSLNLNRGNFLEAYYILMRFIDDVVDGDAPLPNRFSSREKFVEDKINFARELSKPRDEVDYLMLFCFNLASKFNKDFSKETADILLSLYFDAKRIGRGLLFSKAELEKHFYRLDISGTIRATLKIFGEDASEFIVLQPLGYASRIYYNLRDYNEDVKAGLINIPTEDLEKFNISESILSDENHPAIKKWFADQAKMGESLLEDYWGNLRKVHLKFFTKIALHNMYVIPAKKFFQTKERNNF